MTGGWCYSWVSTSVSSLLNTFTKFICWTWENAQLCNHIRSWHISPVMSSTPTGSLQLGSPGVFTSRHFVEPWNNPEEESELKKTSRHQISDPALLVSCAPRTNSFDVSLQRWHAHNYNKKYRRPSCKCFTTWLLYPYFLLRHVFSLGTIIEDSLVLTEMRDLILGWEREGQSKTCQFWKLAVLSRMAHYHLLSI